MIGTMNRIVLCLLAATALRCGTMMHGSMQQLPVTSTPPGATARAVCAGGMKSEVTTPASLSVARNAEGCSVTVEKSGYRPQTIALQRGKSGAMVANVGLSAAGAIVGVISGAVACAVAHGSGSTLDTCAAAGGLVGLLFPGWLDARTGAMYMQHPDRIDVALQPESKP